MTPPPGEVSYVVTVNADAEPIWRLVRDFGAVAVWNPIAVTSRLIDGHEGGIGTERELTLADGKIVRERLTAIDDRTRTLSYEMVTFPIPVVWQGNDVSVDDEPSGAARVTFKSRFRPADGHEEREIAALNRGAFEQAAARLAHLVGAPVPEEVERAGKP